MKQMCVVIDSVETGRRIKKKLDENGYTVRDVQDVMGFNHSAAVYKWLSGKTVPSIDSLIILSRMLHTSIDDLLYVA